MLVKGSIEISNTREDELVDNWIILTSICVMKF